MAGRICGVAGTVASWPAHMSDGVDRTSLLQPARSFCSSGRFFLVGLSLSSDSERCRISTDRLALRSATATTIAAGGFGFGDGAAAVTGLGDGAVAVTGLGDDAADVVVPTAITTSSSCRASSAIDLISENNYNTHITDVNTHTIYSFIRFIEISF